MRDTSQADSDNASTQQRDYNVSLLMSLAPSVPEKKASQSHRQSKIPVQGGGTQTIRYDLQEFRATYLDEYTREPIPHHLAQAATREELD